MVTYTTASDILTPKELDPSSLAVGDLVEPKYDTSDIILLVTTKCEAGKQTFGGVVIFKEVFFPTGGEGSAWKVGDHSPAWSIKGFKKCERSVTLTPRWE